MSNSAFKISIIRSMILVASTERHMHIRQKAHTYVLRNTTYITYVRHNAHVRTSRCFADSVFESHPACCTDGGQAVHTHLLRTPSPRGRR